MRLLPLAPQLQRHRGVRMPRLPAHVPQQPRGLRPQRRRGLPARQPRHRPRGRRSRRGRRGPRGRGCEGRDVHVAHRLADDLPDRLEEGVAELTRAVVGDMRRM